MMNDKETEIAILVMVLSGCRSFFQTLVLDQMMADKKLRQNRCDTWKIRRTIAILYSSSLEHCPQRRKMIYGIWLDSTQGTKLIKNCNKLFLF